MPDNTKYKNHPYASIILSLYLTKAMPSLDIAKHLNISDRVVRAILAQKRKSGEIKTKTVKQQRILIAAEMLPTLNPKNPINDLAKRLNISYNMAYKLIHF